MAQPIYIVRGFSNTEAGHISLIPAVAALWLGIYWLYKYFNYWPSISEPYNFITETYYYLIVIPIDFCIAVWAHIVQYELTIYPNVNLITSILGIITCALLINKALKFSFLLLTQLGLRFSHIALVFFGPAFFGIFWYLGGFVLAWLFATH